MEELVKEGDHGCYCDLASGRRGDDLSIVFMPSLAALLEYAEQLKRIPLSEEEVVRIRDQAVVVATKADVAAAVVEQRGYPDVDAADPWRSWQAMRKGV